VNANNANNQQIYDLLGRIDDAIFNIQSIISDDKKACENIANEANRLDYQIPENRQITELRVRIL
jgi:archaellum component FlaC